MVRGRGRPRKIDPEVIFEVLSKYKEEVLLPLDAIVSKENKVWEDISDELGKAILPTSLYSFVTCNVYGIRDKLRNRPIPDSNDSPVLADSELEVSHNSVSSNDDDGKTLRFFIFFTKSEFDNLVITKTYKRTVNSQVKVYERICNVFNPGIWEESLAEKIWEVSRSPCGFNLKNHRISNDRKSGTVNGVCRCGSTLRCEIVDSNEEDIRIKCTVQQGDGTCGKRYLRQPIRKAVAAELQGKSATVYRAEKAKDLMHPGDPESPHLRSRNVLNVAKNEYISATHIDRDPVIALAKMQLSSHKNMIHHVSLNPFFVYYWTHHQLHAYRQYAQERPACIAIDATGSIVKKVVRCDNKTKSSHIFLYGCVVCCESRGQFSVAQMLTENHQTTSIQAWLMEWLNTGAIRPKEVVCDSSKALLTASIRAFTPYSTIDEYADAFFESSVPNCWIRIDVAHFIKMYANFLKDVNWRIRKLFLASLGQLILCRSIGDAEELLKSILIVAWSETEGSFADGMPTPCEVHKERLGELVTEETISELDNSDGIEDDEYQDTHESNSNGSKWLLWSRNIFDSVKSQVAEGEGNRVNAHYVPKLAERLVKDIGWLPLWSCVFRNKYGYGRVPASSAPVESDFNQIKNRLLKNTTTPMRADDYVGKHLDYLNGRIKIIEANASSNSIPIVNQQTPQSSTEHEDVCVSDINTGRIGDVAALSPPTQSDCPACINGDIPTGAHSCIVCSKPVHALDLCSIACDENAEGHGQKRICLWCNELPDLRSSLASQELENWRGLATPKQKKRRESKYLQKNFTRNEFILHPKLKKLPVLRNGNNTGLQSVKIGKKQISLENTCAFDSMFQILLAGACDVPILKNTVDSGSENDLLFKLIKNTLDKGLTSYAYRLRTLILTSIFPESRSTEAGNHIVPCQITIGPLCALLFRNSPAMEEVTQCDKGCTPRVKKFPRLQIPYAALLDADFQNYIQNNVLIAKKQNCCTKGCSGKEATTVAEVGNFVTLEVYSTDQKADVNPIVLGLIPKELKVPLRDDIYRLIGVVHFTPPVIGVTVKTRSSSGPEEIGHYSAICHRRDGTWVMYDGLYDIEKPMANDDIVTPHILVYAR